jgi:hypothetical protein
MRIYKVNNNTIHFTGTAVFGDGEGFITNRQAGLFNQTLTWVIQESVGYSFASCTAD